MQPFEYRSKARFCAFLLHVRFQKELRKERGERDDSARLISSNGLAQNQKGSSIGKQTIFARKAGQFVPIPALHKKQSLRGNRAKSREVVKTRPARPNYAHNPNRTPLSAAQKPAQASFA
jgi:hypothetical protein